MKKILLFTLLFFVGLFSAEATVSVSDWTKEYSNNADVQAISPDMAQMGMENFMDLTPRKYRKLTGKRLGLKKSLQLKAAQKAIKKMNKRGGDMSSGVYILLAILGLGWLAMGLTGDWDGNDWIINLVLTLLCWLPGVIHALVKKKDYV